MRQLFRESLQNYHTHYFQELQFVQPFLNLLEHPRCYYRDHMPGHLTASAFIVDRDASKVLLVHHAKLNRWLQPGGHADGEEDLTAVALKETWEETGVRNVKMLMPGFFDIDIHPIPARGNVPTHDHYDVRFLLGANSTFPIQVSEESHDVKWVELNDLEHYTREPSLLRMKDKYLVSVI
ncbi:MAG: NUDIX hydrolase [Cyclobacteriaceae bacterium]